MKPDPLLEEAKKAAREIAEDKTVNPAVSRYLLDELIIYVKELKYHVHNQSV